VPSTKPHPNAGGACRGLVAAIKSARGAACGAQRRHVTRRRTRARRTAHARNAPLPTPYAVRVRPRAASPSSSSMTVIIVAIFLLNDRCLWGEKKKGLKKTINSVLLAAPRPAAVCRGGRTAPAPAPRQRAGDRRAAGQHARACATAAGSSRPPLLLPALPGLGGPGRVTGRRGRCQHGRPLRPR